MNRLSIILIAIAFVGCECSFAQNQNNNISRKEFEGEITYLITEEVNGKKVKWQNNVGDTLKYIYKNGNYKIELNGDGPKTIIYLTNTNTQYYFNEDGEIYHTILCDKDKRKIKKTVFEESEGLILGRKCIKKTDVFSNGEIHVFECDTSLYINPEHYSKHQYTLLNQSIKSLPAQHLRYTFEVKGLFKTIHTAVKIEEFYIDDRIFQFDLDNIK